MPGETNDLSGLFCLLAVAASIIVVGLVATLAVTALAKRRGWFGQQRSSTWLDFRAALSQIAASREGRLMRGTREELPRLVFHDGTATVVVEVARAERPLRYYVGVRLLWPDAALRLEVLPRSLARRLRKMLGMNWYASGDPQFDRAWTVLASDVPKARQFLSPEVRQWLVTLAQPQAIGETYLRIAAAELLVRQEYRHPIDPRANVPASAFHNADPRTIEDLLQSTLKIYAAALREPLAGIAFTDEVEIDPPAPICLVCGEPIVVSEVMCQNCRTPHHRECWNYLGGCSLFGCGGQNCVAYELPPL